MSTDNPGGAPKKLTTKEILAAARAKAAGGAGAAPAPPHAPAPAAPPVADTAAAAEVPAGETPAPAAEKPPVAEKPIVAAKAGSTKDILAAARAAAAGKTAAADKPAATDKPGATGSAPAKPAGDKPRSTADILAAARGKAAPAAPAGESPAKPAAAPAAQAKPSAAPGGKKPSVQEMLAAVRDKAAAGTVVPGSVEAKGAAETKGTVEKRAPAPAAEPKPRQAPPMPAKPMPAPRPGKGKEVDAGRRWAIVAFLLSPFALAWTAFATASVAGTLAMLRFMLPNVLTEPPSKFKVGPVGDYDLGTVSEKFKASNGIWLVHTDRYQGRNLVYALSTVCTHLGCTPSWLDGEQKYKCPCHGSGFYITGINFEGPAPRPLERVGIRISEDGMLEVDKSLKFQEEMGQWSDPASYVEIA